MAETKQATQGQAQTQESQTQTQEGQANTQKSQQTQTQESQAKTEETKQGGEGETQSDAKAGDSQGGEDIDKLRQELKEYKDYVKQQEEKKLADQKKYKELYETKAKELQETRIDNAVANEMSDVPRSMRGLLRNELPSYLEYDDSGNPTNTQAAIRKLRQDYSEVIPTPASKVNNKSSSSVATSSSGSSSSSPIDLTDLDSVLKNYNAFYNKYFN